MSLFEILTFVIILAELIIGFIRLKRELSKNEKK